MYCVLLLGGERGWGLGKTFPLVTIVKHHIEKTKNKYEPIKTETYLDCKSKSS